MVFRATSLAFLALALPRVGCGGSSGSGTSAAAPCHPPRFDSAFLIARYMMDDCFNLTYPFQSFSFPGSGWRLVGRNPTRRAISVTAVRISGGLGGRFGMMRWSRSRM